MLTELIVNSYAQVVINGDARVYAKYKRATALEGAAKRRIVNMATAYADRSDSEYASYTKRMIALAYAERGSAYGPDGTPIPGNENLDSQAIDPRTPPGFGNPFMREIHKSRAMLSKEIVEEAKFWNVSIPVQIGDETLDLPIHNGDFSAALTIWYQNNYENFVKKVESKPFNEKCEVDMDTEMLSETYVENHCRDHCHCYGHDHNCCVTCRYGQIGNIFECQWYKVIMDAQVAIAQSIMYQRRRERCLGANNANSGGEESTGDTKQKKLDNPVGLKTTKDHPMNKDVAISKGVF